MFVFIFFHLINLLKFLSKQKRSSLLRKTESVARAKPKSLIPKGVKPKEKAIPNKCIERIIEENLVYKPTNKKIPKTTSKKAFERTRAVELISKTLKKKLEIYEGT